MSFSKIILLGALLLCTPLSAVGCGSFPHQCQVNHAASRETGIITKTGSSRAMTYSKSSKISSSIDRARIACQLTQRLLHAQPGMNGDPEYVDAQSRFYQNRTETNWSSNCWKNASCIVSPGTTQELAEILKIIRNVQSSFSIRSGGHDFNVNHSSIGEQGILIDMVNFNDTILSADKKELKVGVGARWGDVYNFLNGSGVSVNGARSPNPGVGGQTLGGGIGWFSNLVGTSASSVIAVEIILANSTIIYADTESHADLLWALRGGGPNFGVVTYFIYKTLPIDKMWFEARTYTMDKNSALLNALVEYEQQAVMDTKANIVYQLSINTTNPQSFVGLLYLDPIERPPVFQPFYNVEESSFMINSTIGNLAELSQGYYEPVFPQVLPSRDYVVSIPHTVDNSTYQSSYLSFQKYAEKAATFGAVMNYGAQPITPTAVKASKDTPLGLEPLNQDWVHVTINWDSAMDDAVAFELIHDIGKDIQSFSELHGSNLSYRFMNDAHEGQNVFGGYGEANLIRLRQISQAYDPDGTFQYLQNGGWLLT